METEASPGPPAGVPVLVMIVDDQRPFRRVAKRLIDALDGFEVVAEADSGEAAVDRMTDARPSLVLMDVSLPGMSGLTATQRIVSRDPSTVVILTSTYDGASLADDVANSGAAVYIAKEELTPEVLREAWTRYSG